MNKSSEEELLLNMGSAKDFFIYEEWQFPDKGIQINRYLYIYIYLYSCI